MKKILCTALCLTILAATPAWAAEDMSKGILLHNRDTVSDVVDLGCDEVITNLTGALWKDDKNGIISLIDDLNSRGLKVTMVLLKEALHTQTSNYEMITKSDMYYIRDVANTLGNKVGRYVIGNEINSQEWNFAGDMDTEKYCRIYASAFTESYHAIKAANPDAEVYIPFNYGWRNGTNNKDTYSGKEVLTKLAAILPKDMDWGVAWHPYPDPLNSPDFLDDPLATDDENAVIVGFKNLHVLTDYMQRAEMRKADGSVRNIILSEEGFTSINNGTVDEASQAEFFRLSWEIAKANPYIRAYLLSRQVDATVEVQNGWAFGLWNCAVGANGADVPTTRKLIWEVFRTVNMPAS